MKIKLKNKLKLSALLVSLTPIGFLISCGNNNDFYFANFESYMNPTLMQELKSEYDNLNFRSFSTNEDLERSFVRNYDVAVPSLYLMVKQAQLGLLEKIDWKRFNLNQLDSTGQETAIPITNADDALTLFSEGIQVVLNGIYDIDGDGLPDNILEYGVPYFFQDFVLGYKGEKQTISPTTNTSWKQIIDFFGGKVGQDKPYNKIAMIDDYRTVYSIPRIIQTDVMGSTVSVNPPSGKISIDEFQKTYEILSNRFASNSFLLNSDSGLILNNFANPAGSDVAIMYNGDFLYALQGGDEFDPFEVNEINFIRPDKTLFALDVMVINKNTKNLDEAYDIVKRVGLQGSDKPDLISETNVDDEYVNGPMLNFDYVQYTSPLRAIDSYVLDDSADGYFSYLNNDELAKLCREVFQIKTVTTNDKDLFEKNLDDLQKSNMYYAYVREKSKF